MIIREFIKSDLDEVLKLFYNTIHSININYYTKEQVDAWGVVTPDKDRWLNSL